MELHHLTEYLPAKLRVYFVTNPKVENYAHSVAIHFMHYNFVRIHQTLRVTPAMAAGVSTKLWDLVDMARVIEDWESRRAAERIARGETLGLVRK